MEVLTTLASTAAAEAIKKLAEDMSSFATKKVSEYYTDITNKELVDSGWAFEEYLFKVRDMYSKSKTILYRDEKKELEKFFEPLFLFKREYHFGTRPKTFFIPSDNLEEIFKKGGHSKVLITGIGGMGKTILLKHLCVNAIDTGYKIPIFVSLRWFNDMEIREEPLEKLIYERLRINGFKLEYKYFLYSLEGNKYVVFLDGYDEISNEKQPIITRKIADFTQQYSDNYFIMTSRPVEQISCWNEYRLLELCPMNLSQIENLILKLEFDAVPKKKFISELRMGLYKKYKSFVSIPLTLSILFITYDENTTMPETLPDFYEMAFNTLLYRHDRLKEGYERVLKSKLGRQDFRAMFTRFCYETYFKDLYSFSEVRLIEYISSAARKLGMSIDPYAFKDDLVDVVCMLVHEGQDYNFLHRSFQEYFAAYYVSLLPDDIQKLICSTLKEAEMPKGNINNPVEMTFFKKYQDIWLDDEIEFPIKFRDVYSSNYKTLDFYQMLQSIEPKRFELIILKPIYEKTYKFYSYHDKDIIKTSIVYTNKEIIVGDEGAHVPISEIDMELAIFLMKNNAGFEENYNRIIQTLEPVFRHSDIIRDQCHNNVRDMTVYLMNGIDILMIVKRYEEVLTTKLIDPSITDLIENF